MTGEEIMNQALNDEGLKASTFRVCVHDLNDKRTCPDFSSNIFLTPQDSNILWVVYNPSLQKKDLVSLAFPNPYLVVTKWNPSARIFEAADHEIHCSLDGSKRKECEVFVSADIRPMSYQIFKLSYNLTTTMVEPANLNFLDSDNPIIHKPPRNASRNIH